MNNLLHPMTQDNETINSTPYKCHSTGRKGNNNIERDIDSHAHSCKRHKYTEQDRNEIISFYDQFKCKARAMEVINSITGFEQLKARQVRRWKNSNSSSSISKKSMGRPVSEQFELEVLEEYHLAAHQLIVNENHPVKDDHPSGSLDLSPSNSRSSSRSSSKYDFMLLRECAAKVLDFDYHDDCSGKVIKKWQFDKRTCNLRFTNKWISGTYVQYCIVMMIMMMMIYTNDDDDLQ